MADVVEWKQMDEWYWQASDGWTICKVWVSGAYLFEIWKPNNKGSAEDNRSS